MEYYLYEKQDKPQLCGGLKTSVKRKLDNIKYKEIYFICWNEVQ